MRQNKFFSKGSGHLQKVESNETYERLEKLIEICIQIRRVCCTLMLGTMSVFRIQKLLMKDFESINGRLIDREI